MSVCHTANRGSDEVSYRGQWEDKRAPASLPLSAQLWERVSGWLWSWWCCQNLTVHS